MIRPRLRSTVRSTECGVEGGMKEGVIHMPEVRHWSQHLSREVSVSLRLIKSQHVKLR